MRKILLLSITVLILNYVTAQDFSNKGKDFWVGYGYHQVMNAGNGQNMVLYFATDQITTVTIDIPGIGFTQTFPNIPANTIFTTPIMPKGTPDARLMTEGTLNKGIHVTATNPIVAYAHIYNASVSGACVLLPTSTLGKEYYSINYTNVSNSNNANCWFYVIAADTGTTTIEITPSANTVGGWIAGVTYTVTLTQGQIYNVMGVLTGGGGGTFNGVDLTGSRIKSISTANGGCKRIAVYSGSGRISIRCPNTVGTSSDNYMVQAFPKTAWGKRFLTSSTGGSQTNNIYRVCVSDPTAVVRINGVVTILPLINNFYYEIPLTSAPQLIESNLAITVAQYTTSQNTCGNGTPGDPEVIYLSPVEQNIKNVLFNSNLLAANTPPAHEHYVNVIIPNGGTAISSFLLDGLAPIASFIPHPQDPTFSYIRLTGLGLGQHTLASDSGFNAIAYGFGGAESYGYNAGTNVRDLTRQLELGTTYGIETSPSVCTNSPFVFKVYFPDSTLSTTPVPIRFDSLRWSITDPSIIVPNNFPILNINPTIDSTNIRNGRQVNWYSLPTTYFFNAAGLDTLILTAYASTNEGCGTSLDYIFPIQISDPPLGDFTWTPGGCVATPYQFLETTPQLPKPTYRWYWNFGDPGSGAANTSTIRNPQHTFSAPGTYTVKYVAYTTPGCVVDTVTKTTIVVPDLPNATITGSVITCLNSTPPPITFTGSLGTPEYTFNYTIDNGGGPGPVLTSAPSVGGIVTIAAPTNVAGTFIYNLVSVRNVGTAACTRNITGQSITVVVNPLPTASISGTTAVCLNSASPLVTFTGAVGTAPYTFTYNINGGANQTITTVAGNSVTITVPTTVVGTFSYNLVSVQDASPTLCNQLQSGSAIITVNPLPTAGISGTTTVCLNAASPLITFTGAGSVSPYTFTYNINGGANQTVTTTVAGNSVTVAAPTNVAGTFTYNLVSVQDGSSTACSQAQTGSAIVIVNPLPTASITGTITVCLNAPSPNVTFTGANATAPYTFSYTINGGPVQTVTTVAGNSVTVAVPTGVAGTFTYTLVSVQDGSSTTCIQTQGGSAIVTVNPLPTAAITGTTAVCLNAASPNITFTGAVGTAPYTFSYTINGGPVLTVTTVAGNSVTVAAPTNVAGTFTYALVSVQEGSANTCSQAQSGSAIITVNPLPTASIAGTIAVCRNAPSPLITFTGASTVAPYTFTYNINGGANLFVTTVAGNSVTVAAPTNVAGTFTYNLISVQDGSSTTCVQAQSGSAVVTVHPLPTPNFTSSAPSCETRTISFTDASVPNVGTLTNWAWNFGDPGSGAANTSTLQNPTHVFAAAGTYNVTLSVTTSNGCVSNPIATIPVTINNRPTAGFIIPEVCLSDTYAQFLDTSSISSGTVTGWEWDFGDPFATPPNPNTSTLRNPTHSYSAVGSYNVQLIVTSNNGCRDTITQVLVVNGSFPVANFNVLNPTTLCANDSVSIVEASTVFPGVITKVEIYWDNVGFPAVFDTDNSPFSGKIYRHLYPNFQAPLIRVFTIRYRAYSGGVCVNDRLANITVNAAPLVQFNNMPNSCLMVPPFQITQASETGGVPGTGVFSGPGVSPTGIFSPGVAGIGTHTLLYTYTSAVGGCIDTMSNTITVLDTAHAAFTFVTPSCERVPTSFTDISTAPASVVLSNTVWDFGDGTPLENHTPGSTFGHVFAAPGTYTVTMHNVSAAGCLSTDTSALVTISANHSLSLSSANDNQTVCINTQIVNIVYALGGGANNATVTGLPAGLTAIVTGGNILTITGSPTTTVGSPFRYDVITTGNTCVVADTFGFITVQPDHTITLTSNPTTIDQSVCVNTAIDDITFDLGGGASGPVTFTPAALPPGITSVVVGNVLIIRGTPTSTAGGPVFNYTITTNGNGCVRANTSFQIQVHPYPVTSFTFDKGSYCIPNALVGFINTTTPAPTSLYTYNWDFGDGSSSNLVGPSHWYATAGPFNVKLTARSTVLLNNNVTGCAHDSIISLNVIHPQPKADFVFSKPGICVGDRVTITDNTDGKGGIVNQWFWDLGDGTTDNRNPLIYLFRDTITYPVKLYSINSFGCNSDTITKPFTVYPFPHVNAGPDKSVLEGGSVLLETVTFANSPQYTWTPDLYLTDGRIARPRVENPKTDMTYRLTVTNNGGCSSSDIVFVKLLKFPVIPNTFTPNGDGINDTWRIDYLNTYPSNRVQIFTRSGQLIFESRGYDKPWDGTMRGKPMPFDTYYYIIEPGNGRDPITGYVTIIK